jgi:hypothetical protein
MTKISKVLEIDNCRKEILIKALYTAKFWEEIKPTKGMQAEFIAPNVLHSKIYDQISIVNVPIEMEGELLLDDKGEQEGKGRLIEFNVRNNKDVKELEGRLRIKSLSPSKSKVGVFIEKLVLTSDFLNMIGGAADLTLQMKITDMLRNLEKYCKTYNLMDFL